MTDSEPSNAAGPWDEQLVAYLDGELDAESGRRIEALLAADPELRRRIQSLERTWELLDELDTAPGDDPLTHTTLEMVGQAADEELRQKRSEAPRRRRRWLLALIGIVLVAAAAGFASVALLAPDPNRRLIEDLPVLERLDQYRHVEGIEFLRLLKREGLFSDSAGEPPETVPTEADEPLATRRERVAAMSPEGKEELRLALKRFEQLPADRRESLRRLHEQLAASPDAVPLAAIMDRYYAWLKTLPPYSRSGLAEMPAEKRVEWIKKRLQHQRLRSAGRLGRKDYAALWKWMQELLEQRRPRILDTLSEPQRKRLAELSPPMRRRLLIGHMLHRWGESGSAGPPIEEEDLEKLRRRLSPDARKRLESVPVELQWKMAVGWLWQGFRRPGTVRGGRPEVSKADDERLARFFEKELSPRQRDRLLGLPSEQMQRELHRLFLLHARSLKEPHRRPGGFNYRKRPPGNAEKGR